MTPPFGWLTLSFMGQNLENNGHGHLASRHIIIIIKYYKYVQKILRDSIWLHDPSKVAVLFETGAQSTHFQNRFPEAMNDRGDDSKMFRNLAVQLCNSRTRAVSIIEALSTLAVRAVRAVPKSAGYREIWWNNFVAHLTGWVTCGLINLRFGEVQVPRKQSCNSPASQRFTFWIQLSAQACRQSDKLLPSEGIEGGPGRKEKKGSKSWPSMRFISNIIPAL